MSYVTLYQIYRCNGWLTTKSLAPWTTRHPPLRLIVSKHDSRKVTHGW